MLAGMVLVAVAVAGMFLFSGAQAATAAFVQGRAKEITSGTTNSLAFSSANTAGNLIVVYVDLGATPARVTSPTRRGNTYTPVASAQPWGNGNAWRSQVFYAKNIAGGANTVTATFGTAITSFGDHLHPRVLGSRLGPIRST